MKQTRKPTFVRRASVVAVQSALAIAATTGSALAQTPPPAALDPAAADLVMPTNYIDIGGLYVDESDARFGEYNGLQRDGLRADGSFELRGGEGYKPDSGSAERWRIHGENLGRPNRSLGAEYSQQGRFRVGVEYDELRRYRADDYLTVWRGAGGSVLTLPGTYPAAASRTAATFTNIQGTTGAGGGPANAIAAALTSHHLVTDRQRLALSGEVVVTPRLSLHATARTERKEGTKLTGVAFGGFRGAAAPEPIDHRTHIVEGGVRYNTPDTQVSLGYMGSFFENEIGAWSAENPFFVNAVVNERAVMSSPPDNQAHQVNFDGAMRVGAATKATVSGSYAVHKQGDLFNYQAGPGQVVNGGATHISAKTINTNFAARASHQFSDVLDFVGGFRWEHRDSRNPIGTYAFVAADGTAALAPATRTFNNLPQNRKQATVYGDGQYQYGAGRVVTVGIEHQEIRRSFDPPAVLLPSHENPFLSGAASENTLRLGVRHEFNENVAGRISLSHAKRDARDYLDLPPTAATPAPGVFPQLPGFRQFFLNDRTQSKVRGALDWQVTKEFAMQAAVEYLGERYPARYGLKKAESGVFSLDGTYTVSDRLSVTGFASFEDSRTHQDHYNMAGTALPYTPNPACPATPAAGTASNVVDSCREWSVTQGDNVWTVGAGVKWGQLLDGKLTLTGDIAYSAARTNVTFGGGTYGGAPLRFQPAADMPGYKSTLTDLRLGARYEFAKDHAVRVGWQHRRLSSSDPQFDLFGITTVQAYIGSGMQSPKYRVNAVHVAYTHTFR